MLAPSWFPLKNSPCEDMPHPSSWPQVGSMLAPCCLHVGSMLAHVGSMLAHVGPSGLQDGSRCHYVDSGWPQDGQHGLLRSPQCQMSSILEQKVFVLEHPQAFEKLKVLI